MPGPRFSTRGEYGLRALVDFALHPDESPIRVTDLAARQDIPPHYLEQLLSLLRKAGLVRSARGPRGGFELARPASEISLLEALTALEGDLILADCLESSANRDCPYASACALRQVWQELSEALKGKLRAVSIAELGQEQSRLQSQAAPTYQI